MADVLAFVEHKDGQLGGTAREAVATAARLAGEMGGAGHAIALGSPGLAGGLAALGDVGAAKAFSVEHADVAGYGPEAYAAVLAEQVRSGDYAAVVLPATALGKDLAPRLAALLDVPLASDATALSVHDGALRVTRPVYSGKAFATMTFAASPALVTIRPNVFSADAPAVSCEVVTSTPEVDAASAGIRVVEVKGAGEDKLDVTEATVIVSGGRGMGGPENWGLLEDLQDALGPGTALGASRAVVDAGWRPHGEQVGQTGKTVAPKLYFAMGISGAIQHLAGMRTSQTIVAVNRDADAPIFGVADYGIVGDLHEVVPRLAAEIRTLKAEG